MTFSRDAAADAYLNNIKTLAEKLVLCDGEPATYTAAQTDHATGDRLGEVAVATGDFTLADGDVTGRKITVAQKTGIPITVTGSWSHWALVDVTNTALIASGAMDTARAVSASGTATCNSFKITVPDVAAV